MTKFPNTSSADQLSKKLLQRLCEIDAGASVDIEVNDHVVVVRPARGTRLIINCHGDKYALPEFQDPKLHDLVLLDEQTLAGQVDKWTKEEVRWS